MSYPAGALGFDALDPTQLYTYANGTLNRSDDDGANWTALPPPAGTLQIDPNVADRIWLDPGSTQDLQVSNNGGLTWSQVSGSSLHSGYTLVRGQSNRVFLWTGAALKSSSDAGLTWSAVNLPTLTSISEVWADSQDSQIVYVNGDTGLFATTNGGTDWHFVDYGGGGVQLMTSPTERARFFLRGNVTNGFARSDDAGVSVYPINGGLGPYATNLRWGGQPGHYLVAHGRKWALTTSAGN